MTLTSGHMDGLTDILTDIQMDKIGKVFIVTLCKRFAVKVKNVCNTCTYSAIGIIQCTSFNKNDPVNTTTHIHRFCTYLHVAIVQIIQALNLHFSVSEQQLKVHAQTLLVGR